MYFKDLSVARDPGLANLGKFFPAQTALSPRRRRLVAPGFNYFLMVVSYKAIHV
jgi:hypothetical protein